MRFVCVIDEVDCNVYTIKCSSLSTYNYREDYLSYGIVIPWSILNVKEVF